MNHAGNTIASQSGSTYSIYLSSRIVNLLADRESDSILIAISKEMLATELLLPLLVILDFGSQTSGLTFMVKVYAINGFLIRVDGNISTDAASKAHAIDWHYIFLLSVYIADKQSEFTGFEITAIELETVILSAGLAS